MNLPVASPILPDSDLGVEVLPGTIPTPQSPVRTRGGDEIVEPGPIVIIGPNGAGKTRLSRTLATPNGKPIEVVNALRNVRISPQLQAMALQQAKDNFVSQRDQARNQPYELSSDFDFLLTSLLAEASNSSLEYLRQKRLASDVDLPPLTTLERIQKIWSSFFPGRQVRFHDYSPLVTNSVATEDPPVEYSAWQMSDGEKAALYLAGRALNAERGAVLLVDEPETHFHTLLAVEFWDTIEAERPDLRLIYVTHNMHFATSRKDAHFLLASPADGLRPLDVKGGLPDDLAALILGTASLSFYAQRIVFCEGDEKSYDRNLYAAWFNDSRTVFRPVGSSEMVMRCVSALRQSSLVSNLVVQGIIDRDFHSDAFLGSLPEDVHAIGLHEVESLLAAPPVVSAVANFMGSPVTTDEYAQLAVTTYTDSDRHRVILERWKRRVESLVVGVVASVKPQGESLDDIAARLPAVFDREQWEFSPVDLLTTERTRLERVVRGESEDADEALRLMPGKALVAIAARACGMTSQAYVSFVIRSIADDSIERAPLRSAVRAGLSRYIPFS